jgi:Skp family chaperone for outer membrane proteins
VKRMLLFVLAVLGLGAAAWLGNQLLAQAPGQAAGVTGPTRIATINLAVVLKGYKKFELFNKEMRTLAEPYEKKAKEAAEALKKCKDFLDEGKGTEQQREQTRQNGIAWKRILEDNNAAAAKVLVPRQNEKLVQLYREIQDATSKYAVSNGIRLVLQFEEPAGSDAEVYTPLNVARKMKASTMGAYVPLYQAPGMDISQAVLDLLNAPYVATTTAAPGSGTH